MSQSFHIINETPHCGKLFVRCCFLCFVAYPLVNVSTLHKLHFPLRTGGGLHGSLENSGLVGTKSLPKVSPGLWVRSLNATGRFVAVTQILQRAFTVKMS